METTVKGEYNAEPWITADNGATVVEITVVRTPSDLRKLAAALNGMAGMLEA